VADRSFCLINKLKNESFGNRESYLISGTNMVSVNDGSMLFTNLVQFGAAQLWDIHPDKGEPLKLFNHQ